MSIAQYPASLPYPQLSGHGYTRDTGARWIDLQNGTTHGYRKWHGTPAEMPVVWQFSSAELDVFEVWCADDLTDTADEFLMDILTPSGIRQHRMCMTQDPDVTELAPDVWQVKTSLSVQGLYLIDDDVYEFYQSVHPDQQTANDAIPRLDQLINTDLPESIGDE